MITLIDIIFHQSGEFYNQGSSNWFLDLLKTIIGVFIGSGVSVWILYRNFKHEREKEDERRRQFQREKIKYLGSMTRSIIKDLRFQIDALKEFSDTLKANPLQIPLLRKVAFFNLERVVHKINQEEYYHSYLGVFGDRQNMIDEFSKAMLLLDYFIGNNQVINESLEKGIKFDYERKTKFKTIVESAMDEAASLLLKDEILQGQNDFWRFINESIINFHRLKERQTAEMSDIKFYFENYVDVIKIRLIDFSRTIPAAHKLLVEMKNATFIYSEIKFQNNYLADEFIKWFGDMNKHFDKLTTETKRLVEYNGS